MSNTVSKPGVLKTLVALASAVLLGLSGLYLYSNFGHLLAQWSATEEVAAPAHFAQSDEDRAREYAEFKKGFIAKVESYKVLLVEGEKAAAMKALDEHMAKLTAIEVEYIKIRPNATEPDRDKLKKMILEYSHTLAKVNELNYQLGFIRDARSEVTNAHMLLKLTSPKHYDEDRKEIKALLQSADQATIKIYDSSKLLVEIGNFATIALSRLKPEDQETTPEMMHEAQLHGVEIYLNQLTAFNAPTKKAEE